MIDAIVQAEIFLPRTFADMVERDWGLLFHTPTIPDSHDGNHACVLSRSAQLTGVVAEIEAFYESRGVAPRVYYVSARDDNSPLRDTLVSEGFAIGDERAMRIYVHRYPSRIAPNPAVRVRRVGRVDADMLSWLASMEDLRMAKVIQRRALRVDDWLSVGEIDGQLASVALLERDGDTRRPEAERN